MNRLLLLAFFAAANLSASVIYEFTVDTSSLSGQLANLDFQLNPDGSPAAAVTATISGFVTDGTYDPAAIILTDDALGALPDTLTLDNGTSYNDAFQPISLATSLRFFVTLSGAGVNNPDVNGSTFAFSIYDSAGVTPLLTDSPDGSIAGVNFSSQIGIVPYANPPAAGQTSDASVTPVPEPATYLLVSLGLATAFARRFLR
jgi:PEP-CTERM motif